MSARYRVEHREFSLDVDGRTVPVATWTPAGAPGRRPLLLVGHGGSGHKKSPLVLDIMHPMVQQHGFVVVAIDGPVHGARRAESAAAPAVLRDFRELWARGGSIDPMVADWRAVLDMLCDVPEVDPARVGWYGVSMGTSYGLPFLAVESRVRAAVLGMWGTCRIHGERLADAAMRVHVPVLFQVKSADEIFTQAGQGDLFRHLASLEKRFASYAGGHIDPAAGQLRDAIDFLIDQLARTGP